MSEPNDSGVTTPIETYPNIPREMDVSRIKDLLRKIEQREERLAEERRRLTAELIERAES